MLQSNIRENSFRFNDNEEMKEKVIFQVEYLYDVWVTKWIAVCSVDAEWYAEFKWQASHDKSNWVDITGSQKTSKFSLKNTMMYIENDVEWQFANPSKQKIKYKHWRIYGLGGKVVTQHHMNLLFMNIE